METAFSVGSAPRLYNEDPRHDRHDLLCKAYTDRGLVCSAKGRNFQ
jgi:hypothetical protein